LTWPLTPGLGLTAISQLVSRGPPALPHEATFRLKGRLRGREPSAWS
jgi:hypothetical protein